jgi:hypothetical protein
MEGFISLKQLKKLTEFVDSFCGTTEPSHRKVTFFYDKGLKVYASDGCAKMLMNFSRDFLPFDGVSIIPIRYLKGLLRGSKNQKNSIVKLSILEDKLEIEYDDMTLSAQIQKEEEIPYILKEFTSLKTLNIKDFYNTLDYVSVSANEDDFIEIYTDKNLLNFRYQNQFYILQSSIKDFNQEINIKIPFTSARHIVKSLKKLNKNNNIAIGYKNETLLIYAPGLIMNICSKENDFLKINFSKSILEKLQIDPTHLKKALDKFYISFSKNNISYLIFKQDHSFLYKKENDSNISWKLPYSTINQYLIKIHIRKLRSYLSRMKGKITLFFYEDRIMIKDKNDFIAIMFIEEIKLVI